MPWKFIGHRRSTPKYFLGANLYGNAIDLISSSLVKIPLYRYFHMILLCGFVMVVYLSFYVIGINTVFLMLYHIRLHVRLISAIFIDHLEAILLSALTSSFKFPLGYCRYTSAFWDFFGSHFLIRTR